jgi:hypothetical protein
MDNLKESPMLGSGGRDAEERVYVRKTPETQSVLYIARIIIERKRGERWKDSLLRWGRGR